MQLVEMLKNQIKASLSTEMKAEIDARIERERAEARLLDKIAKRVASWSPDFRFKAVESNDPAAATTTATPAATPAVTIAAPTPNACASVQCQNGGTCIDGKCKCHEGFSGERCETKNTCDPNSCLNGGKCQNNKCVCAPGWLGATCANPDPQRCRNVVCMNGGTCQKETGACLCFGNFKGAKCEIAPPPGQECTNVDCKNGAICKAPGFCQCINGFKGKYCEVDPCTGVQCQNGGQCSQGKCVCVGGWAGRRCTRDPCKNMTCHNGGTCQSGSCKCTPEWEGPTCLVSMKTPAPLDVKPVMIPAWDQCACPNAAPMNCSLLNETLFCPNSTIKANVTRINETISMANVNPSYPCHTIPCQNGGTCIDGKCKCHGSWTGLLCEQNKCLDGSVICHNGGVCHQGECRCPARFSGMYCEKDACEGVVCQNGGTCEFGRCKCTSDFGGRYCQRRSNLGLKRDHLMDKIDRLTKRLEHLDLRLPRTQNITSPLQIKNVTETAAKQVTDGVSKAMQAIHDQVSNSHHQPPRRKKDIRGKYRWHQQTPPAVIKQRIDAVKIPKQKMETGFHRLHHASELNKNASTDHKEFPDLMKKLDAMALTESESQAEVEVDTEADQENAMEMEMDEQLEAEEKAEDRAEQETRAMENDAAFYF